MNKKILYICDQSPFDNSYGSQQRTSLLFEALCTKGDVDLVCFTLETLPQTTARLNFTIKYLGGLKTKVYPRVLVHLKKILNIFFSISPYSVYNKNRAACKIIYNLLKINHYDLIVIRYIKNAFICGLYGNRNLIVDVDDLPEQSILSYLDAVKISGIKHIQYMFYAKRAKFHTNRFLIKIKHSFFSNENQCIWKNSSYLPNIPFPISDRNNTLTKFFTDDDEYVVLFVGYMNHSPNFHGVNYFIENIWPKVKEAVPKAVFKIAGKGVALEQKGIWEKYSGVEVLGFVSDLSGEYRKCRNVVVPIYYGGGTNIKILEAMSMRRACVITDFAARAYKNDLIDGNNILVAQNDQDFSNKVIRLLLDKNYNISIAIKGEKTIEEKYSYSVFIQHFNKYIY
jgi:glycosyltransferase involved in cell wall biosynthesis